MKNNSTLKSVLLGYFLILICGLLLAFNFVVAKPTLTSRVESIGTPLAALLTLKGQYVDKNQWKLHCEKVPSRFFVLPHCAACSKTPARDWPRLLKNYTGRIVSPNFPNEWPKYLSGWAAQRHLIFDPEGRLMPADAYDAGPLDLEVGPDGAIIDQFQGWLRLQS